jgi:hypothetical protein
VFSEQGDNIVLTLTCDDHNRLLLVLGYALGTAAAQGKGIFSRWDLSALINRIEEGNPNFTPNELPKSA